MASELELIAVKVQVQVDAAGVPQVESSDRQKKSVTTGKQENLP